MWEAAWVGDAIRYSSSAIVVLLLIFTVLKPALQASVSVSGSNRMLADHGGDSTAKVTLTGATDTAALPAGDASGGSSFDQNLTLAKTLVQNEPARAARMIQSWLINE